MASVIMIETGASPRHRPHRQRRWVFRRPGQTSGLPARLAARPR